MKEHILIIALFFLTGSLGCQKHTAEAHYDTIEGTNAVIVQITYRGIKSVELPDMLDWLNARGMSLSTGSQPDPTAIMRTQMAIKQLLAEHGHKFAVVKPSYEEVSANTVRLVFTVNEGQQSKSR